MENMSFQKCQTAVFQQQFFECIQPLCSSRLQNCMNSVKNGSQVQPCASLWEHTKGPHTSSLPQEDQSEGTRVCVRLTHTTSHLSCWVRKAATQAPVLGRRARRHRGPEAISCSPPLEKS